MVTRLQTARISLILAASVSIASASDDLDPVVDGLQRWLDETTSLSASFEQTLLSGAFGSGLVERGVLYLERPGRMRWDYTDPETKIALIEGHQTRLYVEEDAQLLEGTLEGSEALLLELLAVERPLTELFRMHLLETPGEAGNGWYRLRMAPLAESGAVASIVLSVQAESFGVGAADVLDGAGNTVSYRFFDHSRNRGLPDGTFEFEPPPGTEVLRLVPDPARP